MPFKFEITHSSKKSRARAGILKTPHGNIQTPAFLPVATLGIIKGGIDFRETTESLVQCKIVNTFHFLDLGEEERVYKAGGLHKFTNFSKTIFTDSGGFQVFSLGKGAEYNLGKVQSIFPGKSAKSIIEAGKKRNGLVKRISEEGARFFSPRDGREIMLTPEKSALTQIKLGADFIYPLDICGSVTDNHITAKKDLERTERWFKRYIETVRLATEDKKLNMKNGKSGAKEQEIFGIVQGGTFKDLRVLSIKAINELPFFGIAIGGSLGEDKNEMIEIISWVREISDNMRPHHLLGIGDLESIPKIIKAGIDLFDCALPTRIARHGSAIVESGYINIKRGVFKDRLRPIDKKCGCFTCVNYSLAQINFLIRAKESLAGKLLTLHNLYFIEDYLKKIRLKITENRF